ncbi:hypothetical protein OFC37_34290, partial [Escherichia coli]|nr:hypothetical protein [Escherichia coli]
PDGGSARAAPERGHRARAQRAPLCTRSAVACAERPTTVRAVIVSLCAAATAADTHALPLLGALPIYPVSSSARAVLRPGQPE